jgi:DDE family transposase
MGKNKFKAFADRGYFNGTELKACEDAGITTFVPKPMTSNAKAEGRFDKSDFVYIAKDDQYQCPANERAIFRCDTFEKSGLKAHVYWSSSCPRCAMKSQCTTSDYRRIRRWEHEAVLERVQRRLDRNLNAMTLRRRTVEHVFGTLKYWMGSTHFLTKTLANVRTEMSLHVLAYNLKRVISLLGITATMKAMRLAGA